MWSVKRLFVFVLGSIAATQSACGERAGAYTARLPPSDAYSFAVAAAATAIETNKTT